MSDLHEHRVAVEVDVAGAHVAHALAGDATARTEGHEREQRCSPVLVGETLRELQQRRHLVG